MSTERLSNLLGAAGVAISDLLDRTTADLARLQGEGPAALLTIGTRPGRSIEHLRRTLGLTHSGTVRIVDRLEERGWVKRQAHPRGRAVHLELTAPGRTVFDRVLSGRRRALDQVVSLLPEADRESLEKALSLILGGIPSTREEAWRICRLCEHDVCREEACPVGSVVPERAP